MPNKLKAFLSGLASAKPMNTFPSTAGHQDSGRTRTRTQANAFDEPPAKRQRVQPAKQATVSHYFARPSEVASREDGGTPLEPDDDPDVYEIISNSSTSKTAGAPNSIEPYRTCNPSFRVDKENIRKRERTRRTARRSVTSSPSSIFQVRKPHLDMHTDNAGSPDDFDPPPAQVVSDIISPLAARKHHRSTVTNGQTTSAQHAFKRIKRSCVSDYLDDSSSDELGGEHPGQKSGKSNTNFTGTSGPRAPMKLQAKSRGDIAPTPFDKPSVVPSLLMPLRRAVADSYFYDGNLPGQEEVSLGQIGNSFSCHSQSDGTKSNEVDWLTFALASARGVSHSVANSAYVVVEMKHGRPTKLFLQFRDREDAARLITRMGDVAHEVERDSLEAMFERAFKKAVQRKVHPQPLVDDHSEKPRPGGTGRIITEEPDWRGFSPDTTIEQPANRRRKLKDGMTQPSEQSASSGVVREVPPVPSREGVQTRRTRKSSVEVTFRQEDAEKWSEENREWESSWVKPLVFPPTGKVRTTVDKVDIPRLDEGEFLNDNLISFYLRYLQVDLERRRPDLLKRIYFFNTFFYDKLKPTKGKINYDGVKAWTSKIDIFSYDYLIVPVNEHAHWYVAIVCNVSNMIQQQDQDAVIKLDGAESPKISSIAQDVSCISLEDGSSGSSPSKKALSRSPASLTLTNGKGQATDTPRMTPNAAGNRSGHKLDPKLPRIITLDSLALPHSPTCVALREYLTQEAYHRKSAVPAVNPLGLTAKVPSQDNYWDCGVFVLGYVEEFLKDPDVAVAKLLQKQSLDWDIRPLDLRSKIRTLLFHLQDEQRQLAMQEKHNKQKKKHNGNHKDPEVSPEQASSRTVHSAHAESPQPNKGLANASGLDAHSPGQNLSSAPHGDTPQEQSSVKTLPNKPGEGFSTPADDRLSQKASQSLSEPPQVTSRDESRHNVMSSGDHAICTPQSKAKKFVVELQADHDSLGDRGIIESVEDDDSLELIEPVSGSSTLKSKNAGREASTRANNQGTRNTCRSQPRTPQQPIASAPHTSSASVRSSLRSRAGQEQSHVGPSYSGIDRSKPQSIDLTG
ncbi:hypothetical protein S40293_00790 [Stachybotrys chartarum IBT 40293]|nr:hypothetical protein S40293_00790 [Stachybotrys chartarum IBT 40293]